MLSNETMEYLRFVDAPNEKDAEVMWILSWVVVLSEEETK
jgi:hypothetical protein